MPLPANGSRADGAVRAVDGEGANASSISQQGVRVPAFWPEKILVWFTLLEAQFTTGRITRDDTKFHTLLAQLGRTHLEQVEDVILNPSETGKYEHLKRELIKRLSESDSSRVKKLIEGEEMGDRTPSQFFRHLKGLATPSTPDELVLTIWRSRLPTSTQRVLAASASTDTTTMTEMADRVHEIHPEPHRLAEVSRDSDFQRLLEDMRSLTSRVNALSGSRRSPTPKTQRCSFARRRSKSPWREPETFQGVCWYHHRFGKDATKCRKPCSWKAGNEQSRT